MSNQTKTDVDFHIEEILASKILTVEQFSLRLNTLVLGGSTYMDSILHICDEMDCDATDVSHLISPAAKEHVRLEAISMNLLKSKSKAIC